MLNENGELIMENQDTANTFNDYLGSTVENINLLQMDKQSGVLYPLKTSENQRFSDVFRVYRNVTLD